MLTKNEVDQEITYLGTLQSVVSVYQQLAASRMQATRQIVLSNRIYYTEVNQIYQHVKISYQNALLNLKQATQERNGKTVLVLISANTGLYGDVVERTFQQFVKDSADVQSDLVVIGSLGKIKFNAVSQKPFDFYDFPDSGIDSTYLQAIVVKLAQYEKVYVYHGLFKNIIRQETTISNLTADNPPSEHPYNQEARWLFEPTLGLVLAFFEEELFSAMMAHTLQESHLAKFASRLVTLDHATDKINDSLGESKQRSALIKHRVANKKQLQTLVGRSLWAR